VLAGAGNGADGEGLRLVSPPPFVFRSFKAAQIDVVMTTPAMVGAVLRQVFDLFTF